MCRNDMSTFENLNIQDKKGIENTCHFTGFSLGCLTSDLKDQLKARLPIEHCI